MPMIAAATGGTGGGPPHCAGIQPVDTVRPVCRPLTRGPEPPAARLHVDVPRHAAQLHTAHARLRQELPHCRCGLAPGAVAAGGATTVREVVDGAALAGCERSGLQVTPPLEQHATYRYGVPGLGARNLRQVTEVASCGTRSCLPQARRAMHPRPLPPATRSLPLHGLSAPGSPHRASRHARAPPASWLVLLLSWRWC